MDFNISTERLELNQPSLTDVDRLFYLMSDPAITHFLTWEAHKDIETTKKLVESLVEAQAADRGYHWCVKSEGQIIGLVSLIDVRRKIRTWTINRAELSYWIGREYQGKGYATEASRAVVEYGFNYLNFHKIIVAHANENVESGSICRKLGFVKYAHEHDAFQKDDVWHDLIWYELKSN